MNQGKLEVVKQEMARVNINILDGMGREVGRVFRIGNTCTPVADSC